MMKLILFLFYFSVYGQYVNYPAGGGSGPTNPDIVMGPPSSASGTLAAFADITGKILKDTGILYTDVITSAQDFTAANHIVLTGGANKTLSQTDYTIPPVICAVGETIKSDGTNLICALDINTNILVEDILTSNSIVNALSANQGRVLNEKIIPLETNSHSHANKVLLDSLISNGTPTEFLSADGTYKTPIDLVGTGDIVGPALSTDNAIPRFDGTDGKKLKDSGVLISDTNDLSEIQMISIKGSNTNNVQTPVSALNLSIGRTSSFGLNSGQSNADITIERGSNNGGYRHFITSMHSGSTDINNQIRFYLNTSSSTSGSTEPGVGNDIALSITPDGVGVLKTTPSEALDISGNTVMSGSLKINDNGTDSLIFPLTRGNSGEALLSDGAGNINWGPSSDPNTVLNNGSGTDNALPRFDGTGQLIKDSGVIVNDSNDMTGVNHLTIQGALTINASTTSSAFPTDRGNDGQFLKTDGTGILSWSSASSLDNWQQTHDYKFGETVVSPTNSNDIFRAKFDHTSSTDFIVDRLANNWELISPTHYVDFIAGKQFFTGDKIRNPADGNIYRAKNNFIGSTLFITDLSNDLMDFVGPSDFTTSTTSGGVITFAAPNYQITAGTGYIRTNNGPKNIKWNATNIDEATLPNPTGYNTIMVNNAGTVTVASGMDSSVMAKQNIVLGNVSGLDRKIIQRRGASIDHGNTSRNLSHALGIIKNGMGFRGNTGTQTFLTESGNINFDGINPTGEMKDLLDCSPQATTVFRLYDQDSDLGMVSIIPNSDYDVAGTLTPIGGTSWAYFKISVSLDCSISLQYGQDIKPTKNEIVAAEEENRDLFVVNPALKEGVLYSGIVFFVNGNIDFGDLATTVWKNSGKLGVGSPGSGGSPSTGDVLGPASSNDNAIVVFDGGSGKTIKGSGVAISAANDITGAKDLTITGALKINDDSTNGYIFPLTRGTANQLLQTDGLGGLAWVTPAVQSGGDVVGPISSLTGNIAYFIDDTGKTLGDAGLNYHDVNRNNFVIATSFNVPNIAGICSLGTPGGNPLPITGNTNGVSHSDGCTNPFYTPNVGARGAAFYAQNSSSSDVTLFTARTNLNIDLILPPGTVHSFVSNGIVWNYQGVLDITQWNDLSSRKLLTQFNEFNATVKGFNYNPVSVPTAAFGFATGRSSLGALASNQVTGDISFEYGGANGGFKHYIETRHAGTVNSNGNAIKFYLNNSTSAAGSSGPGVGNTMEMALTPVGVGVGTAVPFDSLDVMGDIVTSFHANSSQHNAAEVGSRRIGHISGNNADFAGMQINVSGTDSDGAARANSSNIAFYTWGNSISASREVAKITERGNLNIIGNLEQGLPYTILQKAGITGGGLLNSISNNVVWTQRFITIGWGKRTLMPSGYFDITMPPNGTIVKGQGGLADVTVTGGKVPLTNWQSLWYELPIGSTFATNNNNFRISYFNNGNFSPPAHWVLVAHRNGDTGYVTWADGSVTPGSGDDVSYDNRGIGTWVGIPSTNAAIRASGVSVRYENFGATVRLRGVITPTNNSDGGMGAAAIFGNVPVAYRPTGGYFNNGEPAHVFQINVSSFNNIGPPANGFVNSATGDISFANMSGFESKFDTTWSL
jgi:hypothetical protein